jgi:hypothetical protein
MHKLNVHESCAKNGNVMNGALLKATRTNYRTVFYEFLKCGLYNMYNTFCLI